MGLPVRHVLHKQGTREKLRGLVSWWFIFITRKARSHKEKGLRFLTSLQKGNFLTTETTEITDS